MTSNCITYVNFPGRGVASPWRRRRTSRPTLIALAVLGCGLVIVALVLALGNGSRSTRRPGEASFQTVEQRCRERARLAAMLETDGN